MPGGGADHARTVMYACICTPRPATPPPPLPCLLGRTHTQSVAEGADTARDAGRLWQAALHRHWRCQQQALDLPLPCRQVCCHAGGALHACCGILHLQCTDTPHCIHKPLCMHYSCAPLPLSPCAHAARTSTRREGQSWRSRSWSGRVSPGAAQCILARHHHHARVTLRCIATCIPPNLAGTDGADACVCGPVAHRHRRRPAQGAFGHGPRPVQVSAAVVWARHLAHSHVRLDSFGCIRYSPTSCTAFKLKAAEGWCGGGDPTEATPLGCAVGHSRRWHKPQPGSLAARSCRHATPHPLPPAAAAGWPASAPQRLLLLLLPVLG